MLERLYTSRDAQGRVWPPGGGDSLQLKQEDGATVALLSHGDAFDLYVGRETIYNVTLTPRVAFAIMRWLWRLYVWRLWFGVRPWLWRLVQERRLNARLEEQTTPARVER